MPWDGEMSLLASANFALSAGSEMKSRNFSASARCVDFDQMPSPPADWTVTRLWSSLTPGGANMPTLRLGVWARTRPFWPP